MANYGVALLPLDPGQRCVVRQKQEGADSLRDSVNC